jgi:hypothetical protein
MKGIFMKENKTKNLGLEIIGFMGSLITFGVLLNLLTWGLNQIPMVEQWKAQNAIKQEQIAQEQKEEYQTYIKGKFKIEPLFSQTSEILKAHELTQWPAFGTPSITMSIFKGGKYHLVYESLDSCNNYKNIYSLVLKIKDTELNCEMIN